MIITAYLYFDKNTVMWDQCVPVGNYDNYETIVQHWLAQYPSGKVEFVIGQAVS